MVDNISLRDWFAGQALAGSIRDRIDSNKIALWAYELADAMLAVRNNNCVTSPDQYIHGVRTLAALIRSLTDNENISDGHAEQLLDYVLTAMKIDLSQAGIKRDDVNE